MERVAIDEVPVEAVESDSERRRFADALETTAVSVNRYRIAPGDGLPAGLHTHADQEELFVVLAGTAAFEILLPHGDGREGREITVRAGEAIRFAPGEFQSGHNVGKNPLIVLAVGAPRDGEPFYTPLSCPDCRGDTLRIDVGASGVELVCPDCGAAHVPAGCPGCGAEMRATLSGDGVGVVCPDCGHRQATPPLR